MNATFAGHLLTGETLRPIPIEIGTDGRHLELHGLGEQPEIVPLHAVRVSERLGRMPRFLYLPDGRSIETADNDAVDTLFFTVRRAGWNRAVRRLEERSHVAAVATVLLVAGVVSLLWFGLPIAAREAADRVPARIEKQAGEVAWAAVQPWFQASALPRTERERVRQQLNLVVQARGLVENPRLEFRTMERLPNAFALPGGRIVITDDLVRLASNEELAAVFAHEIAHWKQRHGLQAVLRGSAALLVVTTVTGDLSTLTSFAATLPLTLLQRGYSREFEIEADDYAAETLRLAGLDPKHLATILAKMAAQSGERPGRFSYLSTHPSSDERIRKFDPSGEALQLAHTPPTAAPRNWNIATTGPVTSQATHPPVPLGSSQVRYPPHLRAAGIEGTVTVGFIVDREGMTHIPFVVSSTNSEFDEAALEAIRGARFSPAKDSDGNKISTRAQQEIRFLLTDEKFSDRGAMRRLR